VNIALIDLQQAARTLEWLAGEAINWQRQRLIHKPLDAIQFNLDGELATFPSFRNPLLQQVLGRSPLSLVEIEQAFRRIGDDPRPRAVILNLRSLRLPLADVQTLRQSIARLRAKGKRVVAYAQSYDLGSYLVASACEAIYLQPTGVVLTLGLLRQEVYLKDALAAVGLEFDSVAISPYKSAADQLSRSEPSPEVVAQSNWLLDSWYEQIVAMLAEGRGWTTEQARTMIDGAPYTDQEAQAQGVVDGLCHEETLRPTLGLGQIVLWEEADGMLPLKVNASPRYVAVLNLSGTIVNGESAAPPPIDIPIPLPLVGEARIGDVTTVNVLRHILKDRDAAALVVYVDSPGGSATASEAIAATLDEIARTRPVVVCMGAVAASGGYYISTSADHIVAQGATVTGSIGVILGKLVNNETLKKLRMNAVTYQRGANAGILSSQAAFTEDERARMLANIQAIYGRFVARVADGRKMKPEAVDAIGGGRVWTGAQAQGHGLVDQLGGLVEAIEQARQMAKLPADAPARLVRGRFKPMAAELADRLDPAAALRYGLEGLDLVANGRAALLMPSVWR